MSRRKGRSAARENDRESAERVSREGGRPAAEEFLADDPVRPRPSPRWPSKRFLAVAVLLQATWITFLLVMALAG